MSAPQQDPTPNQNYLLVAGAVYLLVLIVLSLVNPTLGIAVIIFNAVLALATGVIFVVRRRLDEAAGAGLGGKERGFATRVGQRLRECRRQEDKFRDEANAIRRSITALQEDIARGTTAPSEEVARAEETLTALKSEFDLRHTKALFFADCATRLQQLLDRHRLNESVKQRQQELNQLRSANFDDEASVEEARYYVEQNTTQLETLEAIKQDVEQHPTNSNAKELQERLDALRKNILGGAQPTEEKKS